MPHLTKRSASDYHRAEKSWGFEVWVENNEEYCGKELHFEVEGGRTSLHFHVRKRETMLCLSGEFYIWYVDTETAEQGVVHLTPGESVEIPRLVPHSIECALPGLLMEFSTMHEDSDSYRVHR